jgi:hypothetical protein
MIMELTNAEMLGATHVFYNPSTDVMLTVQYKVGLQMYELRTSDLPLCTLMSLDNLMDRIGSVNWEFLGVL